LPMGLLNVKVAFPPDRTFVNTAPPSTVKATLPDGSPHAEVIVTTTLAFCGAVTALALILISVETGTGIGLTISLAVELLPAKPPCVSKLALSTWVPALGATRLNVARPPEKVRLSGGRPSKLRFTMPDGLTNGELIATTTGTLWAGENPNVTTGALIVVVVSAAVTLSVPSPLLGVKPVSVKVVLSE
jgi:hypothetical protein